MASVPQAPYSDVPARSPRSPSYAGLRQRASFAAWLKSEREQRGVSRKQLARAIWKTRAADTTTARIKAYETVIRDAMGRPKHVMLPSPPTLRIICGELGLSWLSAFASAGYYRDVLEALAALVQLGWQWLDEDKAFERDGARLSFRSLGVTWLNGQVVWAALESSYFAKRYIAGEITQVRLPRANSTPKGAENIPDDVLRMLEEAADPSEQWAYVVPKPMAAAILVVICGFPRRGDIWKQGVDMYTVHLLEAITPMADAALQVAKAPLIASIARADESLRDTRLSTDGRRIIAAEFMLAWADAICQGYTHYARLASLEYFGLAGVSIDKMTPEIRLPQLRRAALPDVSIFQMPN